MTLRKREDIGKIPLYGGLALEEAVNLS